MSGPGKGWRKGTGGSLAYMRARIAEQPNGCWLWQGTLNDDGYGKACIGRGKRAFAHRRMYELCVGPVAKGLELDHLCRTRACCNPAHLEPVTRRENVRRGDLPKLMQDSAFRPRRKHVAVCKHGHAMLGDNVGSNGARRWCRACKRATMAEIRSKNMNGSKAMQYVRAGAQGDTYMRRVDSVPTGVSQVQPDLQHGGKPCHIIAHSENGSHHIVDASDVVRFEGRDPSRCYLQLATESTVLKHLRDYDQHGAVTLGGGKGAVWEITRQREWDGAAERRAAD